MILDKIFDLEIFGYKTWIYLGIIYLIVMWGLAIKKEFTQSIESRNWLAILLMPFLAPFLLILVSVFLNIKDILKSPFPYGLLLITQLLFIIPSTPPKMPIYLIDELNETIYWSHAGQYFVIVFVTLVFSLFYLDNRLKFLKKTGRSIIIIMTYGAASLLFVIITSQTFSKTSYIVLSALSVYIGLLINHLKTGKPLKI